MVDVADAIASRIGLDMTPVGFRVEDGRIVNATTVPSQRYLSSILPKPIRLRPAQGAPNERGEQHGHRRFDRGPLGLHQEAT